MVVWSGSVEKVCCIGLCPSFGIVLSGKEGSRKLTFGIQSIELSQFSVCELVPKPVVGGIENASISTSGGSEECSTKSLRGGPLCGDGTEDWVSESEDS